MGFRLVLIDKPLFLLCLFPGFVFQLVLLSVLVVLNVLGAFILSMFDIEILLLFIVFLLLKVSHSFHPLLVQVMFYHISLGSFCLHQLFFGILDFPGLFCPHISVTFTAFCNFALLLFDFLIFELLEELLIVFMLQTLKSLSFVLGFINLFLGSIMLHLKHSDSISEQLDIIFNPK